MLKFGIDLMFEYYSKVKSWMSVWVCTINTHHCEVVTETQN